ncbi:MAG: hypothetical protein M1816_000738 [Peltula sp. TS41687]|nr:MAG: hypothetical protein M1816_000738 [Peltula sp. TS41687]
MDPASSRREYDRLLKLITNFNQQERAAVDATRREYDRLLKLIVDFTQRERAASKNATRSGRTMSATKSKQPDFALDKSNLDVLIRATQHVEQSSRGVSMATQAEDTTKLHILADAALASGRLNPSSASMDEITSTLNRRFDLGLSKEQVVLKWAKINADGAPLSKIDWKNITEDEYAIVLRRTNL